MHHSANVTINTNAKFESEFKKKVQLLISTPAVLRGPAHAMKDDTTSSTHELMHVTEAFEVSPHMSAWQVLCQPNLPWAEDHFQERVSGEPLNPAPSEAWWPYARQGNAEHKSGDQTFSHTYPERFWPTYANTGGDIRHSKRVVFVPHVGIRFEWGDLSDLVEMLQDNPNTRQAYLPIWFPEDLRAAQLGERVPCSLGYHFIRNGGKLDCVYTLRSCDLVRFYRDDMYMAGRLLQWVATETSQLPGKLVVHINNLHCFPGDVPYLNNLLDTRADPNPAKKDRSHYNFGAL